MEVLTSKQPFKVMRSCDCGAAFVVTEKDLRCEPFDHEWGRSFEFFVTCPGCGARRDMIHLTPEYLREELIAAYRARNRKPSLLSRFLSLFQ